MTFAVAQRRTGSQEGRVAMATEMAAMWRTAKGLVGVPGPMSHQVPNEKWSHADERTPNSAESKTGWRNWIPALDRTPPLLQFFVRLTRVLKAKCQSGATQVPPLRLVGQLALGAKRHLSLVEVGGVQFLVGGGVEHVTVIVPIPGAGPNSTEILQDAGRPLPR